MSHKKKIWQVRLQQTVTSVDELFTILALDPAELPFAYQAHKDFPLKIPKAWIEKINPGDIADPILQQVLPSKAELAHYPGYTVDPLQEKQSNPVPGLLHKYRSRVLLISNGACGVNCRYCFRRHFAYDEQQGQQHWPAILSYLANHPEVNEVIFSGGDPLLLPDTIFNKRVADLAKLPHINTLRIHSRLPVYIPERLDDEFVSWFVSKRFTSILVTHINHPQEIDAVFAKTMQSLKQRGVLLLNQSVLLKGVNDQAAILQRLSQRLFFECGIQPYYLNILDQVKGAGHFQLERAKALSIYHALLALLPGYLVPKLVNEIPGAVAKIPVGFSENLGIMNE